MCGVIGLIYERERADLGVVAGELLATLEYRGYDSTGAAIQSGESITLRKGVGAPSVMARELGIVELGGQVLCGQVRWATFGAVDAVNAQPHEVRCHTHLYGAHNGNVTNCDGLKEALTADGHVVLSDNDGEMLVHSVEQAFAARLAALPEARRGDREARALALRQAVVEANARLQGSYAAVVVDPVTRVLCAVKKGSSLYFGVGHSEAGGAFGIASSDMSSVLKLTRRIVPLLEHEFVQFDASGFRAYDLRDPGPDGGGRALERAPARSRLAAQDTALRPGFGSYMEQEIADQVGTSRDVVRLFGRGSPAARALAPLQAGLDADRRSALDAATESLLGHPTAEGRLAALDAWLGSDTSGPLLEALPAGLHDGWHSAERALLGELATQVDAPRARAGLAALDALWEADEVAEFAAVLQAFCAACEDSLGRGGRLFVVCCGTSFHAAKVAALFFAEIAGVELTALLPGEFRGQQGPTLRDGDLLVAVSQSGETKDLIDVIDEVLASGRDVRRVALVNNVNSTLAQEKAEVVVPLRCGPEIAVPATKSFVNQLTVFYGLALELAARLEREPAGLARRRAAFDAVPGLIADTLERTDAELQRACELLYLSPSMHLLATRLIGVAKEGALKVREVVLNHTEGFEGSEFKHGPNTILGFNTLFGPTQLDALLDGVGRRLREAVDAGDDVRATLDALDAERGELYRALQRDYPLVYVTGPDPRDVALTISQLNTHKIRGASTVVVAEEHEALRQAAEKCPADNPDYRAVYVALPTTGDTLLTVFSSIVALQRLALLMSNAKREWLDARGIRDHGVHPDVPKNVSKSITVD